MAFKNRESVLSCFGVLGLINSVFIRALYSAGIRPAQRLSIDLICVREKRCCESAQNLLIGIIALDEHFFRCIIACLYQLRGGSFLRKYAGCDAGDLRKHQNSQQRSKKTLQIVFLHAMPPNII